jgi:hypothetical protein
MDRETLVRTIKVANRHVAEGKQHVARQREIVAELKRGGGPDLLIAENLLHEFEVSLALHMDDRDRLVLELAGLTEKRKLS